MADPISRRAFVGTSILAGTGLVTGRLHGWSPADGAPAIITADRLRPVVANGVQSGDVTASRAIVWSRSDRAARMHVDWSTNERFTDARTMRGPAAMEGTGFTGHVDLRDLPADEQVFYRVRFESLESPGAWSEPLVGTFRTAPTAAKRVRVAWSGDMVGQGWGIDESRGGIRMYDALRRAEPDVFIHSGDNIYADQPLLPEVTLDDGTIWRNLVTEAKSKVAETVDEFRGNYAYNMLDEQVRRFHAAVPMIAQWDDHEVVDNWFDGLMLDRDPRYTVKSVSLLAARAHQAMFEFLPIRRNSDEAGRVYRQFSYGPMLDIFVIDLRSYRGANSPNRQAEASEATTLLGAAQLAWLKDALRNSRALWKVIACDMPIGLVVPDRMRDGVRNYEAWANAEDGAPLGRELEVADLLRFMKQQRIRNTVWVTADVHYAAAHHYSPDNAQFTDFDPFWEFVAGPMHAGTFGPNALDATFGPEVRFTTTAPGIRPNRPPSDNLQFYGTLDIDPATRALTAGIWDVTGRRLWQTEVAPVE
ncbi:MAG TPA: alkaline phosphatase D family protein [Longimicrobiales bacterium]|nr:alkaline phosphatase D family protein [Longimicrobiales bacterium]